jgi:hypothetical protein
MKGRSVFFPAPGSHILTEADTIGKTCEIQNKEPKLKAIMGVQIT